MASMQGVEDPVLVAAVAGYFAAIRERDQKRWLDAFEPDAVCHDPVGGVPAEGRAGLEQVWKVLTAPFKRLTIAESRSFYGGSGAAVLWAADGIGVDDGTVHFSGITVFEFSSSGKIQTAMSYWDPAAMLIALAGEIEDDDATPDPSLRN
jgi:hypothetical protein